MSLRIGLVYDLRKDYLAAGFSEEQSAEFDADETITALDETITRLGYTVQRIGNVRALCSRLAAGERWDLVFNIAEGVTGRSREAQVPGILEAYGIPYTFSDPLVCATTMDKAIAKRLVRSFGVCTPDFMLVDSMQDLAGCCLRFPLFAKPVAEGTGKGIDGNSRIESMSQLESVCAKLLAGFNQPVLVEEYLPGREFTTGITGTGSESRSIGTMEVKVLPEAGEKIYSFHNKENWRRLVKYSRVEETSLREEIECLALRAYRALECRDAARIDIRLDIENRPSFLEINTLPGLNPGYSDLPILAAQEGIPYTDLISKIIASAMRRVANDEESLLGARK